MTSVRELIDVLKQAQELDRDIYLAKEDLENIPQQKSSLEQNLLAERRRLEELEAELKKAHLKQKEKEGELAQKEAQIKKLDGQLNQVKTNKEYSAMQQEISSLKADSSILEEEIIRLLDEVEAAEEEVEKEKSRLKAVSTDHDARLKELGEKEKTQREARDRLQKDRDVILQKVDPETKTLYDVIIRKKSGLALAAVAGENCGACQLLLRPQVLNELQMGERLITCESCNRILYLE